MRRNISFALLLVCFFLSGLAGLIYQTAWTREFAFVFGTSNLAIATVLAAYMAGLAAGAAVAARFANRITRPLLTYGVLELGVGLAALAVPLAIHGSRALYVALLGGQPDLASSGGLSTALFYLVCSFLILMVPTALMGATLPLLVRHSVHSDADIGGRIGLLYSINTAGAVVGTVFAAFVLLPTIGLRMTIWVAAAVNGLVFLAAWALARSTQGEFARARAPTPADSDTPNARGWWVLPLIFGSGVVSFTYEVLWVRLLEHLLGGSVYAFSTMLASFLMGIALGAALASRIGMSRSRAAVGFAISQLGIAGLSLAAFMAVDWIPTVTHALHSSGYPKLLIDWAASTLTLFPAATLIGATFPFAVRILARDEADAGSASARVYAFNTLGSVVGSIGAGFFLIPALSYAGTLIACVAFNLILALVTASLLVDRKPRRLQIAAAMGLVALASLPPEEPWEILRYSYLGHSANQTDPIRYFGVGRAATVILLEGPSRWQLRTNGNPESMISPSGVIRNQSIVARWLGSLPSLVRPETNSLLVVGFGGGVVVESVPSLVGQIDVIELEPEVIEANRSIRNQRWRDPLNDPRLTIHLNDARNSLLLTDKRFDAIVSQPSHPWSAGASHLYTQEFFEVAREHLEPGGVFVQWIGLMFVDGPLLRSLLATLSEVFQHVEVYNPRGSGILFLASDTPFDILNSAARALAAAPQDFEGLNVYHPEDVLARILLDETGVRELGRGAALNRDDHNIMQTRSPRILDRPLGLPGALQLASPFEPLMTIPHADMDVFYLARQLRVVRSKRFAETLENPQDVKVVEAMGQIMSGKVEAARRLLDAVLENDPRHLTARSARLQLSEYALGHGSDPAEIVAMPLDDVEQVVISGWIARDAEDWDALRALEASLEVIPRRHTLSNHANQLRALWRIASNDPGLGEEAVEIIDRLGRIYDAPEGMLLRARASVVAGDYAAALDAFAYYDARSFADESIGKVFAKRVREVLREIPRDPSLERLRIRVERLLGE